MQFVIANKHVPALHAAVRKLGAVIPKYEMPWMSSIHVALYQDRVTLTATNSDICVEVDIPAKPIGEFGDGVFGLIRHATLKRFLDIRGREDGALTFSGQSKVEAALDQTDPRTYQTPKETGTFSITSSESRLRLEGHFTHPPAIFQLRKGTNADKAKLTMRASKLAHALEYVRPAISTEATRYYLNGVLFDLVTKATNGNARFIATDGHRMHIWRGAEDVYGEGNFIVPTEAIDTICAMLAIANVDDDTPAEISLGTRGSLSAGNVRIYFKLVDGEYPEYRRIIPSTKANSTCVTLARCDVLSAASAMKKFSPVGTTHFKIGTSPNTSVTFSITLRHEKDVLTREVLPQAVDAVHVNPLHTGLNAEYLRDLAKVFPAEAVEFSTMGSDHPIFVSAPGAGVHSATHSAIIMPLRV